MHMFIHHNDSHVYNGIVLVNIRLKAVFMPVAASILV